MRLNPMGKTYLHIFDFCCFCPFWWSLYELTGELAHNELVTYQNFLFICGIVNNVSLWNITGSCVITSFQCEQVEQVELTWQWQWPWTACCLLTPPSPQRFFQHRFPGCYMHSPCCSLWKIHGFRDIWLCREPLNWSREHFFFSRGAVWPLHHGQSVSSKTIFHVWFITESCHVFII